MKKLVIISFVFIAAAVFLAFKTPKIESVKPENGQIKVALKILADRNPHYFKTSVNGKEVRFFLVISRDGVARAAFDACDVCYPQKKGYSYEGDFLICNNCGARFHNTKVNVLQGGCNPAPLERSNDNSYVTISVKSLNKGMMYF